jgi:hypothetical protein
LVPKQVVDAEYLLFLNARLEVAARIWSSNLDLSSVGKALVVQKPRPPLGIHPSVLGTLLWMKKGSENWYSVVESTINYGQLTYALISVKSAVDYEKLTCAEALRQPYRFRMNEPDLQ